MIFLFPFLQTFFQFAICNFAIWTHNLLIINKLNVKNVLQFGLQYCKKNRL